ncbi:hypothetical protein [Deinococcus sp.]|uniref:hypothetical protein n=1 Tax=Deinococcus sp. TaxID=47478 RepID=UPI003CC57F7B
MTADWLEVATQQLVAQYGSVPPPWVPYPEFHPYSAFWRMGGGEGHIMVFSAWWQAQDFDEAEAVSYFHRWPPPAAWLEWMIDAIWNPGDSEDFDATPYFERVEELGFGSQADYERDLDDSRWE